MLSRTCSTGMLTFFIIYTYLETFFLILDEPTEQLLFEITSARIADTKGDDKKHVVYTLQIRHLSGCDDNSPSSIERRYTDFNNLYTSLKRESPDLMTNITFPKKVLIGNFANKLIFNRSTGFESLLKHISMEHKLRNSKGLLHFLQDIELTKARKFLMEKQFFFAAPLLESSFKLLNKVHTFQLKQYNHEYFICYFEGIY